MTVEIISGIAKMGRLKITIKKAFWRRGDILNEVVFDWKPDMVRCTIVIGVNYKDGVRNRVVKVERLCREVTVEVLCRVVEVFCSG